ncbi:orotidine 5'-phosphate decarboxylase [Companilactobacillus sp. RD055328]|uniref:orotidine-5'-phosphate decarboxylase n=1 Tax=Companilactobacillus sp. RD055328 TaxID=2916634 RepID=UPI001FC88C9C|nr:orotidine-5'-phosphate decarboxylase [Companilactobacillus sp. RD055328]GKQ42787.1 orotidine 5'-phosphate decarboxylase [Companilactobacillus sp. RD055328]
MSRPIIIALDYDSKEECMALISKLLKNDEKPFVKIGLEMFVNYGVEFIKDIRNLDISVFLDLKLNDIPNTVERTCRIISQWDIQYLTVHANGGSEMIAAAKRGLLSHKNNTKLLAVTQLTSLNDTNLRDDFHINYSSNENVTNLAQLAYKFGADGVISSALEIATIKEKTSKEFLCINPGVRPTWASNDEQKRVVTPQLAKELGSDGIVIGRPIIKSEDPLLTYKKIKGEWS